LAGRVLLKIVYLLVRRILGLAVLVFGKDLAKDAELLALRHENAVLRRHAGRIRYEPADRVWFAALAPLLPRRRWTEIFPVMPATLLAWHRRLAASKYDTSNSRKPGRPPTVPGIARVVVRLAKENPLWGYRRIHGELTRLGIAVAPSTVWEILRAAGIDPAPRRAGPTWRQFLHAQATGIFAVDFLHVDTVLLKRDLHGHARTLLAHPVTRRADTRLRLVTASLPTRRFVRPSLQAALQDLGYRFRRAEEVLTARPPTAFEADTLALDPGEWVIQIVRTSYSGEDTPVHCLETICAATRHRSAKLPETTSSEAPSHNPG
jgi:putative transposase